ncbi:hypothetical protein KAR91_16370 [Candidatus Pacearchaeota archaeon]|nr:hypothetical protein [Candidatus Pacearchaeota archaeon]
MSGGYLRRLIPIYSPSAIKTLAAGDTLPFTHPTMIVQGSGGAVTSTATPLIDSAKEVDGIEIRIRGNSDVNTFTIQDNDTLADTNLKLSGGVSMVLGDGDWIKFSFMSLSGLWEEHTRSAN